MLTYRWQFPVGKIIFSFIDYDMLFTQGVGTDNSPPSTNQQTDNVFESIQAMCAHYLCNNPNLG